MQTNMFLIPANSNSGKLIFNIFTKFDLILAVSGMVTTILALMLFAPQSLTTLIICLIPALICAALVVPIPNYHNVYTVLKETIEFFYQRRNYKWEGWCTRDEFK